MFSCTRFLSTFATGVLLPFVTLSNASSTSSTSSIVFVVPRSHPSCVCSDCILLRSDSSSSTSDSLPSTSEQLSESLEEADIDDDEYEPSIIDHGSECDLADIDELDETLDFDSDDYHSSSSSTSTPISHFWDDLDALESQTPPFSPSSSNSNSYDDSAESSYFATSSTPPTPIDDGATSPSPAAVANSNSSSDDEEEEKAFKEWKKQLYILFPDKVEPTSSLPSLPSLPSPTVDLSSTVYKTLIVAPKPRKPVMDYCTWLEEDFDA